MSEDTKTLDLFTPDGGEDEAPIEQHASQAYLGYAVSTVKARALPEIADGLKPVQRRILYAMAGSTTFSKCARYVGEVLGKYHPHGDSSTYEALVHLAQPFSMRYPLIDGQGNFGSRDGDAPAAYRYTEAKLSRFSELLLSEINEGNRRLRQELRRQIRRARSAAGAPAVQVLNGSFGIPVGFSTRIPSHNRRKWPRPRRTSSSMRAKIEDVLDKLPGPDFPGGGQVISPPEGSASLRDRARLAPPALQVGEGSARARPVAHRDHRAAARRVGEAGAAGAGRARRPEAGLRQEGGHAGAEAAEAVHPRPGRDGARRVRPQVEAAPRDRAAPRARTPRS